MRCWVQQFMFGITSHQTVGLDLTELSSLLTPDQLSRPPSPTQYMNTSETFSCIFKISFWTHRKLRGFEPLVPREVFVTFSSSLMSEIPQHTCNVHVKCHISCGWLRFRAPGLEVVSLRHTPTWLISSYRTLGIAPRLFPGSSC